MRKLLYVLVILSVLLTMLVGCGNDTTAPNNDQQTASLQEIVITEPARGILWAPVYLAQTLGFFEEAGISVDFQTISGGDPAAAVFSGDAQFGFRGVEMPLMATEAGQNVKILVSTTQRFPYVLMGQGPDFTTVESLRGQVVAGSTPSGSPTAWVKACLIHYGLDPDKDVDLVMTSSSGLIAAMKTGDVVACNGNNGYTIHTLIENDGVILVDGRDISIFKEMMGSETYEMFIMFATDDYIAENPETVQKVVTAVAKGIQWINGHTTEEIVEALAPLFPDREEQLLIEIESAKEYDQFTVDGRHTESGYQAALKLAKGVGAISSDISAAKIYDESFLEKAWEELEK
ncbi:ABC transporter substrate-binding protein [Candidatus Contubernalis alkaliaceticus]|uniref:ABC transporter substrate-binding protein n=1 Tax=Candidatus Contubernalis alkaliaceticus TaxID=338645 RepID=UPI001F4C2135|nr:ABC transporter substrate-binding protein [Candidatus Contubernalis alkalaceticus]UNC90846.1 ABC transporter substrate-binding protein [Candidatus Contubernalis alkalaceticus]